MKTLIFLLALIFTIALFVPEQATAQKNADVKFGSFEDYRSWPYTVDSDTVSGTNEVGRSFYIGKGEEYKYYVEAGADSLTAEGTTAFYLYGSMNGTRYVPMDTITWSMSTSDTTVVFDSGNTKVRWRYLKPTIKGGSSGTRARFGPAGVSVSR